MAMIEAAIVPDGEADENRAENLDAIAEEEREADRKDRLQRLVRVPRPQVRPIRMPPLDILTSVLPLQRKLICIIFRWKNECGFTRKNMAVKRIVCQPRMSLEPMNEMDRNGLRTPSQKDHKLPAKTRRGLEENRSRIRLHLLL